MAITARGTLGFGNGTTAAPGSITNSSGVTIPAGTLVVVSTTHDNVSATTPTITCSTIGGATAIAGHASPVGSGASATSGSGIFHQCFYAVTTAAIAAGAVICTISSNQAPPKSSALIKGYDGATATLRGTVVSATSTAGTPTVTTGVTPPSTGDLVLGHLSGETSAAPTGDTDTTNGSWSTIAFQATAGGSAVTNNVTAIQEKIVTASGAQTFNPTTANDSVVCIYAIQPVVPPTAPTSAPTVAQGAVAENIDVTVPATLQGGALSYKLYRSGVFLVGGLAAGAVYGDNGQDATLSRTYTVRGTNSAGDSADSPASSAIVPDPKAPVFTATPGNTLVDISITGRAYAAKYKVYRRLSLVYGDITLLNAATPTIISSAATGPHTITKPTLSDGCFVILPITVNAATTVSTAPTGFTLTETQTDSSMTTFIYTKYIATAAGEPAWTITFAAAAKVIASPVSYMGVDSSNPFVAESGNIQTGTATSLVSPSVNVNVPKAWLVFVGAQRDGVDQTLTMPDTTRSSVAVSSSSQVAQGYSDTNGPATQGSTTRTWTSPASTSNGTTWIAVLRPASTGGGSYTLVHTSATQTASATYNWQNTGLTNGISYDFVVTTEAQTPTVRESAQSALIATTPTSAIIIRPTSTNTLGANVGVFPGGSLDTVIGDNSDTSWASLTGNSGLSAVGVTALSGTQVDTTGTYTITIRNQWDDALSSGLTVFIDVYVGGVLKRTHSVSVTSGVAVSTTSAAVAASDFSGATDLSTTTMQMRVSGTGAQGAIIYDVWLTVPTAAAGPNNYSRTPSDNAGIADVGDRITLIKRVATDIGLQSDQDVVTKIVKKVATDTEVLTDTASPIKVTKRFATDLAGLVDSAVRSGLIKRLTGPDILESDSVAYTYTPGSTNATRNPSDTETLSDVASPVKVTKRFATDTEVLSDVVARLTTITRNPADLEALSDVATRLVTMIRNDLDLAGLADSVVRIQVAFRTGSDLAGLADSSIRIQAARRSAGDTLAETDLAARTMSTSRAASEAALLSDTLLRLVASKRTPLDTEVLSDTSSYTNAVIQFRSATELAGILDSVVRQVATRRALLDAEGLTDLVGRQSATKVSKADTEALSDVASRTAAYKRTGSDVEALSDTAVRVLTLPRFVTDTVGLFDFAKPITALKRLVADTSALSDTSSRRVTYVRIKADQESLLEAVLSAQYSTRALADVEVLVDSEAQTLQRVIGVQDNIVLLETVTRDLIAPVANEGFYVWNPGTSTWVKKNWAAWDKNSQSWVDGIAYTDLNYDSIWEST